VQKFTPTGRLLLKWGGRPKGASDGQFQTPGGIAVDLDQTIYVTDIANNRIQEFTTSGAFLAKAGSMGSGEAQFTRPFGIASVPPGVALGCLFGPTPSDCVHGLVVSEAGGGNTRVQFLAGRADMDLDGITDEIDLQSGGASASFSDAALGFTTFGNIVSAGDQTFAIYNLETPAAADQIRVRAESFGGLQPLKLLVCGVMSTTVPAGGQPNLHCSTPTVEAELGPVGFQVTGSDGTAASGTLQTGGSVSYDPTTSTIKDNAGSIQVTVGGRTNTLLPGQTAYADQTAPTTATVSANPNRWFHGTTVVTLSATDNQNGSGVNNITYSLSGAQPGSGTVTGSTTTVPLLAEGVTTMTFFATDKAGNQEVPKSVTVKIDKTPPILRCTATPAILKATGNLEKVNLSVTVDDPLSGPAGFVLTSIGNNEQPPKEHPEHGPQNVQGFTLGKASTSGEVRAEITHAKERIYTFTYTGVDQAGNQETCTASVKVIRSREGAESPRKAADAGEGGR
jgi:hypothetical protein